jgi:ribosomal-protein-alanine N-acetyltransferase
MLGVCDGLYVVAVRELPLPQRPLTDGRVMLRAWRDDDAAAKAAWGADALIVRWTDVPANYTERDARAHGRAVEANRRAGRALDLAIVDPGSDRVLGSCDVRRPDPGDPALGELGYLVGPEARGRGVATRALALLVAYAFAELGMARIQALVHPDNPASGRVLERLGFQREGLLRDYRAGEHGREDRVIYSLLAGELQAPG